MITAGALVLVGLLVGVALGATFTNTAWEQKIQVKAATGTRIATAKGLYHVVLDRSFT